MRLDRTFKLPLSKWLRRILGFNSTNLPEELRLSNARYFDEADRPIVIINFDEYFETLNLKIYNVDALIILKCIF